MLLEVSSPIGCSYEGKSGCAKSQMRCHSFVRRNAAKATALAALALYVAAGACAAVEGDGMFAAGPSAIPEAIEDRAVEQYSSSVSNI
jgi:hypothetical protein